MPAYPTFPQMEGSTFETLSGRVLVKGSDGVARSSTQYDSVKRRFKIRHLLQTADLTTLLTFYEDNLSSAFDFVWALDSQTYSCVFGASEPVMKPGAVWHEVFVELEPAP